MHTTRASLLIRLKTDNADRDWEDFYTTYQGVIYRYAKRKGLDDFQSADVLQETMIDLMQNLLTFDYDPEKGKFRNYLLTITHRKIARKYRKKAKRAGDISMDQASGEIGRSLHEELSGDAAGASFEVEDELDWKRSVVESCLQRIREDPTTGPQTLEIFTAYVLEQQPVEDVAEQFGLSANSIYQIKHRLLKRLAREAEDVLAEEEPDA